MNKLTPRYPIYVISKGRYERCLTAKFLMRDKVAFRLVVEPQEEEFYRKEFGDHVLVLPFSNLGLGGIPARNWVWEHSIGCGHKRHWILDDNIYRTLRRYKSFRVSCNSSIAFSAIEDFTDRYENIAINGMNYSMFVPDKKKITPFFLNCHVYSCLLILNSLPYRWRGRYNEDTDLCLQVLSGGYCTVLTNAFMVVKIQTMTMKGGNSDQLYKSDGRLKMSRSLERCWPYVVSTTRRFKRPQHAIKDCWKRFDTPLIRRKDIDWDNLPNVNDYGMELTQQKEIKSPFLKSLIEESRAKD